jgi:uncharacterized protein YdaU (DUF1376 family)
LKLPYFNFYPADFVMGTRNMTAAQKGAYIMLLCHQWDHGFVPGDPRELVAICGCSHAVIQPVLSEKFQKISVNFPEKFQNSRLEHERKISHDSYAKKRDSGRIAANARWHPQCHPTAPAMPPPSQSESKSESDLHEREKAEPSPNFPEAERPGIPEVTAYAQTIGLAQWKALDWLNEMNGGGWLDYNHRPIADWRAVLNRVRTKWEADGRPSAPPSNPSYSSLPPHGGAGASTTDKIIHQKEYDRLLEQMRLIRTGYGDHQSWTDEDKAKWKILLTRKAELKAILGITI